VSTCLHGNSKLCGWDEPSGEGTALSSHTTTLFLSVGEVGSLVQSGGTLPPTCKHESLQCPLKKLHSAQLRGCTGLDQQELPRLLLAISLLLKSTYCQGYCAPSTMGYCGVGFLSFD